MRSSPISTLTAVPTTRFPGVDSSCDWACFCLDRFKDNEMALFLMENTRRAEQRPTAGKEACRDRRSTLRSHQASKEPGAIVTTSTCPLTSATAETDSSSALTCQNGGQRFVAARDGTERTAETLMPRADTTRCLQLHNGR